MPLYGSGVPGRNISCDFEVGFFVCCSSLLSRYLLSRSKLTFIVVNTQMFHEDSVCDFIINLSIVLRKNC